MEQRRQRQQFRFGQVSISAKEISCLLGGRISAGEFGSDRAGELFFRRISAEKAGRAYVDRISVYSKAD